MKAHPYLILIQPSYHEFGSTVDDVSISANDTALADDKLCNSSMPPYSSST